MHKAPRRKGDTRAFILGPLGCYLRAAANSPLASSRTISLLALHRLVAGPALEDRLFGAPGTELGRVLLTRLRATRPALLSSAARE